MKVIFLQDVPRVGKRHDVKEVNDGYALNFLFPKKMAEKATPDAIARLEQRKKEIEIEREVRDDLLKKNLEEIKNTAVTLRAKADEKGHLFSGIHKKEICKALENDHKAMVGEEFIMLDKPIKEIGEYEIPVEVKGKRSFFKLIVEKA